MSILLKVGFCLLFVTLALAIKPLVESATYIFLCDRCEWRQGIKENVL